MLNYLHSLLRRPERGWDPVPRTYAEAYATGEWSATDRNLIDHIEERIGGFAGKRVLDIGAGPGQFAVEFALRKAEVTWHDVSSSYLEIARGHADRLNVPLRFSLGYLEEAERTSTITYDLVFNRICYNYSQSDSGFAGVLYRLTSPGGFIFVRNWLRDPAQLPIHRRIQYYANALCHLKVGHPSPPPNRVPRLFLKYKLDWIEVRYPDPSGESIFLKKAL